MEGRILLVEDDRDLLDFESFLLRNEGYTVETAMDGEEGLSKARSWLPELIVLDALLPRIHGFEVCERLRHDPTTGLLPIVMVTALNAVKDKLTGIKLGADEYITKPFEPAEFLARIERHIVRSRQNPNSSPLTGLPGSSMFESKLIDRLVASEGICVGLIDLVGMSRYNESEGYEKGDEALRLTAVSLRSALVEAARPEDLASHLGGDDFAFIATPALGESLSARFLENVEAALDGTGLRAAVGMVVAPPGLYRHKAQVLDRARAALKEAVSKSGHAVVRLT